MLQKLTYDRGGVTQHQNGVSVSARPSASLPIAGLGAKTHRCVSPAVLLKGGGGTRVLIRSLNKNV